MGVLAQAVGELELQAVLRGQGGQLEVPSAAVDPLTFVPAALAGSRLTKASATGSPARVRLPRTVPVASSVSLTVVRTPSDLEEVRVVEL